MAVYLDNNHLKWTWLNLPWRNGTNIKNSVIFSKLCFILLQMFSVKFKIDLNACSWSCVWFVSALIPSKTFIKNITTFFTFEMTFFLADDQFQSLFYFPEKIMVKRYYSNRKWKLHYWKSIFHMSVINSHVEVKWASHDLVWCRLRIPIRALGNPKAITPNGLYKKCAKKFMRKKKSELHGNI